MSCDKTSQESLWREQKPHDIKPMAEGGHGSSKGRVSSGVSATESWPSPGRAGRSASCWFSGGTCSLRYCSVSWARSARPPCWGRWPAPCRWRPSPRRAGAPCLRCRPRRTAAAAAGTGNPSATGSWHPLSTVLQRASLLPCELCLLAAQ